MSDWTHGYNVSQGYTYGFYREIAPDWLDLCTLASGRVPPRRDANGGFRYLELGCGQGFGLCLLAAANPAGAFVGIDFHAGQIAHAIDLAAASGLTNIRFVEGDFAELGADWPADLGKFDYIALHGIYSWIPPEVRQALLRCLASATATGGLVYNAYNTQPGWVSTMPFQHMTQRLQTVTNASNGEAFDASVAMFEAMFANSPLAEGLPLLKARVAAVKASDNVAYLGQEYLHGHWQPFWFSEVAAELGSAKLDYVGSATAVEQLLPGILPPAAQKLVTSQRDPIFAQEVLDCITTQSFRRDIFCRGLRPAPAAGLDLVMETVFLRTKAVMPTEVTIDTTFGDMLLQPEVFGPILEKLGEASMTLGEIAALPVFKGATHANVMQTAMMLLQNGAVAVVPRRPTDPAPAQRFNATVARAVSRGLPYGHLAAPVLASALPASDIDCMLIDSYLADPATDQASLVAGLRQRLQKLGRSLTQEGKRLEGRDAEQRLGELAAGFLQDDLARWQRLGVLA
jgi:SAM-dependent methyltransferase